MLCVSAACIGAIAVCNMHELSPYVVAEKERRKILLRKKTSYDVDTVAGGNSERNDGIEDFVDSGSTGKKHARSKKKAERKRLKELKKRSKAQARVDSSIHSNFSAPASHVHIVYAIDKVEKYLHSHSLSVLYVSAPVARFLDKVVDGDGVVEQVEIDALNNFFAAEEKRMAEYAERNTERYTKDSAEESVPLNEEKEEKSAENDTKKETTPDASA